MSINEISELNVASRMNEEDPDAGISSSRLSQAPLQAPAYIRYVEKSAEELYEIVEYDMDEEDLAWLELVNEQRGKTNLSAVSHDTFELLLDRFEKESFFQRQVSGTSSSAPDDEDAVCAVCLDGDCYVDNVILFCDMCNLAVHQACYGVPNIPDGSWVCRRCLRSPSKAVDCCLCPSKSGAMKQTEDMTGSSGTAAQWAHVTCAYWIPEVGFASEMFLEPIVGVDRVAPSRWKMACYICKLRGVGACIQCNYASCYTGFHVTCAQLAGLYMKTQLVRDGTGDAEEEMVKKTVYCDQHSLSHSGNAKKLSDDRQGTLVSKFECRPRLRRARKILAENRNASPPLFVPVITVSSIAKITKRASLEQKEAFISRLHCYWTLKRQSRDGAPLLRSLQLRPMIWNSRVHIQYTDPVSKENVLCITSTIPSPPKPMASSEVQENVKNIKRIRQELEKVRLLLELIRKREKLKNETVRLKEKQLMLELQPLVVLLSRTLIKLQDRESKINDEAIRIKDCSPRVIEQLSETTRLNALSDRIGEHQYTSIEEFSTDFNKIIDECIQHAGNDKIVRGCLSELKKQGEVILKSLQGGSDQYVADSSMHSNVVNTNNLSGGHRKRFSSDDVNPSDNNDDTSPCKVVTSTVTTPPSIPACTSTSVTTPRTSPQAEATTAAVSAEQHFQRKNSLRESYMAGIGTGRGRGRPRKMTPQPCSSTSGLDTGETVEPANASKDLTAEGGTNSTSPEHSKSSPVSKPTPNIQTNTSGVNRRTAVLFGNKTRKSEKHLVVSKLSGTVPTPLKKSEQKVRRKPGRPPKSAKGSESAPSSLEETLLSSAERSVLVPQEMPSLVRCEQQKLLSPDVATVASVVAKEHRGEKHSSKHRRDGSSRDSVASANTWHTARSAEGSSGTDVAPIASGSAFLHRKQTGSSTFPVGGGTASTQRKESFTKYRNMSMSDVDSDVNSDGGGDNDSIAGKSSSKSSSGSEGDDDDDNDEDDNDGSSSSSRGSSSSEDNSSKKSPAKVKRTNEAGWSSTDTDADSDEVTPLRTFDLVWAKCKGYPWYPGLIINPQMTKSDCLHNGIPVPLPPNDVVVLQRKYSIRVYLVLFFDAKRTWQWLPRNKLERLGEVQTIDRAKLADSKKPNVRKAVQSAFDKALQHKPSAMD